MQMAKSRMMVFQAAVLASATLFGTGVGIAQQAAAPASVHGHLNDPAGMPLKNVTVQFTKDHSGDLKNRKWVYKFTGDDNGDYKGTGIEPGDYFVDIIQADKNLDFVESSKFVAGEDKTLNFDLSRKEYIDKMSDADKAALAEYKKHAGEAMEANKVIGNLNATLKTVRADLAAAAGPKYDDVSKDVTSMKQAVDSKPDEGLLWITYGDTLVAQGDHLAKDDRAAGKPPTSDDDVVKNYTMAADSFKKGADLMAASKKPSPTDQAIAYNSMGNSLAKAGKIPEAQAAYENAVKLDPAKGGMYYGNEAAVLFNTNQMEAALAAANKAIAADPTRPDPYFIKGQALIGNATVDPKTQKPVAPPGCIEAYQKYLELAPDGRSAPTVKEILAGFDVKIDTKYKAGKK
jgi:tetratricopeptide (TPR) repeat protein